MWLLILWLLIETASAANVFTIPSEVCSGDSVTFVCSREGDVLEWSYDSKRIVTLSERSESSVMVILEGISFTVNLTSLNTSLTISTISFDATPAADGKVLGCAGGNLGSIETIHVVTDILSDVNVDSIIYEAHSWRLTVQFFAPYTSDTHTLEVSPAAVSPVSLRNTTSSNFIADLTLHYNINYTLTITASNCMRSERQHISFLRVNCFIPNVAAGMRLLPFTNTTEGATITYGCSDGYWPQTNQTSQCTQVGSDGVWMPDTVLNCSIVCSVPPSLLDVPMHDNDSRPYVEGDVMNFKCLSANVIVATCTMEGSWGPDSQPPTCSSTAESTATTAFTFTHVIVGVICAFLVGLLCGVALMVAIPIAYIKCNGATHRPSSLQNSPTGLTASPYSLPLSSSSQPTPLGPLYEDIELSTSTKDTVEFKHNVAYGYFK